MIQGSKDPRLESKWCPDGSPSDVFGPLAIAKIHHDTSTVPTIVNLAINKNLAI